jgi:hypothetical protein
MTHPSLTLELVTARGTVRRAVDVRQTVIAGWTGRDREAMEKHIVELEALGVPRPATTPVYYRVASARLTQAPRIEACGAHTSGEVEFVLLQIDGRLWVGIGSDHTDRQLETAGVTLSKQVCDKPVGPAAWPLDEVAAHWPELQLRSFITDAAGERVLYQEGPVTTMLDPLELIKGWTGGQPQLPEGCLMFCGTLAARGGIRPSARFDFELEDPVLGRTLRHGYQVEELPIAG